MRLKKILIQGITYAHCSLGCYMDRYIIVPADATLKYICMPSNLQDNKCTCVFFKVYNN